jgi:hypothetical protein
VLVRAFFRVIFSSYLQVIIPLGLVPCDHQWGIKRFVGVPHSWVSPLNFTPADTIH